MADGPRAPREEGFSKDADKLIRRLSLVALLLSRHGQPVARRRDPPPGRGLPADDRRRLQAPLLRRSRRAGRAGHRHRRRDLAGGGETYSLPGSAYYLPPVTLTGEELSALAACLQVLEGRFAYSQPLRLALVSLAQGRPELLAGHETPALTICARRRLAQGRSRRCPSCRPPSPTARRSSSRTTPSAATKSRERTVDPYGLQLVGDEWYLIGHCHLRQAVRTFRLSRIRSRVRFATRVAHDFAVPAGFDLGDYRDRPAWQLGGARDTAVIAIDDVHGLVGRGALRPLRHDQHRARAAHRLRDAVRERPAAGRLGARIGPRGRDREPAGAARAGRVAGAAAAGSAWRRRRRSRAAPRPDACGAASPSGGARRAAARRAPDDWHVEVDRFTRLTALSTYLLKHCGSDDETPLPVAQVCDALGITAAELKADVRVLNLVNFGGDGALLWAEFKGDDLLVTCDLAGPALAAPARLSPLQADTLLLAIELVGGQLPSAAGAALASAAQRLRRARYGAAPAVAADELLPPQDDVLAAVNTAIKDHRLLEIDYWSEGSDETTQRVVEPLPAWCAAAASGTT